MHRAGISQGAVARIIGVTPTAVNRWGKKWGLPHSPAAGPDGVENTGRQRECAHQIGAGSPGKPGAGSSPPKAAAAEVAPNRAS